MRHPMTQTRATESNGFTRVERDGDIAVVTLDDGRGNALGPGMLTALDHALDACDGANALILRGREKVFCGGLDLPALLPLDRAAYADFISLFDRVFERLLCLPFPVVAAAHGSAVAGGAILLAVGDCRLVSPTAKVGINEAVLGLNFPTAAIEIVRCALGSRNAQEAGISGRIYEGDERLRIGFATEVAPADHIDERARELARELARVDRDASARVRLQLRRDAIERVHRHAAEDSADFVERWFRPETQRRVREVVERLRTKTSRP